MNISYWQIQNHDVKTHWKSWCHPHGQNSATVHVSWQGTATLDGNQHPKSRIPACVTLLRVPYASGEPQHWHLSAGISGCTHEEAKDSNEECSQQETVTDWGGCLRAVPLARLWGSPPTSPGTAPPLGPQRETAVIENMGIAMHMWGEEWDRISMAGAAEEKESTQQLEVAVRLKKF